MTGIDGPQVTIRRSALDLMRDYVGADATLERGGVLVGSFTEGTVLVEAAIPAPSAISQGSSLTFTPEAWAEVDASRVEKYPAAVIVGWFHSHPQFGIFLSRHDRYIHEMFFNESYHIAYVVDPVTDVDGFFGWSKSDLVRLRTWNVVGTAGSSETVRSIGDLSPDSPTFAPNIRDDTSEAQARRQASQGKATSNFTKNSPATNVAKAAVAAMILVAAFVLGYLIAPDSEQPDPPGPNRVPNVVGLSENDASVALDGAGSRMLTGGGVPVDVDSPLANRVVEQDPPAGERLETDATVSVDLGLPMVRVPALLGQLEADAERIAAEIGLIAVADRQRLEDSAMNGRVVGQSPAASDLVAAGSPVSVRVIQSEIPDLVGKPETAAIATLAEAGYSAEVSPEWVGSEESAGVVRGQDPAASETARFGDTVTLRVSRHRTIPDLLGLEAQEACVALATRGLVGEVELRDFSNAPQLAGRVVGITVDSAEIGEGLPAPEGQLVVLEVADDASNGGVDDCAA